MSRRIYIAVLGTAATLLPLANQASGQTFNDPKFFVWGEPATGWPGTNDHMHRMIHVSVITATVAGEPEPNGSPYFDPHAKPAKFARAVAQKSYNALAGTNGEASTQAENLAILIQ